MDLLVVSFACGLSRYGCDLGAPPERDVGDVGDLFRQGGEDSLRPPMELTRVLQPSKGAEPCESLVLEDD